MTIMKYRFELDHCLVLKWNERVGTEESLLELYDKSYVRDSEWKERSVIEC